MSPARYWSCDLEEMPKENTKNSCLINVTSQTYQITSLARSSFHWKGSQLSICYIGYTPCIFTSRNIPHKIRSISNRQGAAIYPTLTAADFILKWWLNRKAVGGGRTIAMIAQLTEGSRMSKKSCSYRAVRYLRQTKKGNSNRARTQQSDLGCS